MSHAGILPRYRINRPLGDIERDAQLKVDEPLDYSPNFAMGIIKMNSTYMDLADKHYVTKGLLTAVMLFMAWPSLFAPILYGLYLMMNGGNFLGLLEGIVMTSVPLVICTFIMLRECFKWTHYPIRFNRKNRMVYFCRFDGTFIGVKWEDVFFFNGGTPDKDLLDNEIYAHILSEDRQTVLETFSLPINSSSREIALGHWEFVRQYMENGPKDFYYDNDSENQIATSQTVSYCLDIDEKREPPYFSNDYIRVQYFRNVGLYILDYPCIKLRVLGRIIAMRTCKPPLWPEWIKEESIIDADDPYVVSAADNKRFSIIDGRELES